MSRWPSLMAVFSGKAFLWITAAEGFVLISGLLVGLVRVNKESDQPISKVSIKLVKRAFILYAWTVIASVIYSLIIWNIPLQGGAPNTEIAPTHIINLAIQSVLLQNVSPWIHFLLLYAVYLGFAPVFIHLIRKGQILLVSFSVFILWVIGLVIGSELLQWQLLFYIAMLIGNKIPTILNWWNSLKSNRKYQIKTLIYLVFISSLVLSILTSFYSNLLPTGSAALNDYFPKEKLTPIRVIVATIWFIGFITLFYDLNKFIKKYLAWLLEPIGKQSLRAYILHGGVILIISYFFATTDNIWFNTALDLLAIMIVWLLIKNKYVQKVVPS